MNIGILGYVAVIFALVVGLLGWQTMSLKKTLKQKEAQITLYAAAQETNLETIGVLKKHNSAWAARCRVDPRRNDAVVLQLERERDQARADAAAARNQREVIYVRDPAARSWRDTPMPVSVADSLFK